MKKTELYVSMGSSNVVLSVLGSGIVLREPSLVAVNLDDEKIEIYIFKIVKTKSINIYRKKKRIEYDFDSNVLENIPADTDVQSEYATNEEWKAAISCLNSMNHCYRDVLTLYFLYDMKPAQIAEALGRSLQTVKSQLQRGKQLLKEALKEWHYV
jgi:RNA polymerase sigma factor (sigma-70 family)